MYTRNYRNEGMSRRGNGRLYIPPNYGGTAISPVEPASRAPASDAITVGQGRRVEPEPENPASLRRPRYPLSRRNDPRDLPPFGMTYPDDRDEPPTFFEDDPESRPIEPAFAGEGLHDRDDFDARAEREACDACEACDAREACEVCEACDARGEKDCGGDNPLRGLFGGSLFSHSVGSRGLSSDDLLLAGLIFMMLSGGGEESRDDCTSAAMLLAILLVAGL